MKKYLSCLIGLMILSFGCSKNIEDWSVNTSEEWLANSVLHSKLEINDGKIVPTDSVSIYKSVLKRFSEKHSIKELTISQSPEWLNWNPISNIGPENLADAPIALQLGENNYWMFGRYKESEGQKDGTFVSAPVKVGGFEIELNTTPFENQFDAAGGLKEFLGGYHAWQSRDMKNWVHHGPVSEKFSKWMTTAEYEDGRFYLYYDFPNDQDPHLYIDEDLTDGVPGKNIGLVFKDPSHGSDCAVIRDLDGNFHIIAEDWSPIDASKRSWDSPLAVHAVSPDGIQPFKISEVRPVDHRTEPTGEIGTYKHPHWTKEDPKNYPTNVAEYEIHEPEQNAYGDWAAIAIGGQYYLFGDFDQAGKHGSENMSVCWFTSDDINKPFNWCGNIGSGHPDPEIIFAEGQFYLITQMETDYVSTGPWVESVEVRVGVDTNNDNEIDHWSDWHTVSEKYESIEGFSKQVSKTAAQMDLSTLPKGYGFQFEIKLHDTAENESKPILDSVTISFEE